MSEQVVVVGSSNTDMVVKVPRIPSAGETILGGKFLTAAGGKGANQVVAAARLGASTSFVSRVGRDMFGDRALENLRKEGIDLSFVSRDESEPSGVALILVDQEGENVIAVASGANSRLAPELLDGAGEVLREASVVLMQLEIPIDTVERAANLASQGEASIILNPAPALVLETELLKRVSVLTPNSSEARSLTGILPVDEKSAKEAGEILIEKGVKNVVITLGPLGAFVMSEDGAELISGFSVQAEDTTAAGDAFNGALAFALASNKSLTEAVTFANRAAAYSVTRMGAQPSLPTREELDEWEPAGA